MSPNELQSFVRFQLAQMRTRNEHHRFEDLCRAFARQRITANILPATGPVAAGGDQARDFETFRTYLRRQGELQTFLGLAEGDTIVFTCTLQVDNVNSKILGDIATICATGTPVDLVVAFTETDVPVAARHALQQSVRERDDVGLEIFDGNGLAELLAQRDTFWIAVQYLDVPSTFLPPPPADQPDWYSRDKARWLIRRRPAATLGDLFDLAGCLRHASHTAGLNDDVEYWVTLLGPFLAASVERRYAQSARLEIAAGRLLGQGDLGPAEELVRSFFALAFNADSPAELEDAAALLLYGQGAWLHGTTNLAEGELEWAGARLEERVEELLTNTSDTGRRCLLLAVLAGLCSRFDLAAMRAAGTRPGATTAVPPMPESDFQSLLASGDIAVRNDFIVADATGAIDAWRQLLALLPQAPLFPIVALADRVAMSAALFVDQPGWEALTGLLDERVEAAAGRTVAASRAWQRAQVLLKTDRPLAALGELQRARVNWITGDTRWEVLGALLAASECYRQLGLLYAAKHYALAAGALAGAEGEAFADVGAEALIQAAQCDYLAGNWVSFLTVLPIAVSTHLECREEPENIERWDDLRDLLQSALIVRRTAAAYEDHEAQRFVDRKLTEVTGSQASALGSLPQLLADMSDDEVRARVDDQLGQPAFADTGRQRTLSWSALGVTWRVQSRNTYTDVMAAERFAAAAQVICAALGEDLVLIPVIVQMRIRTAAPRGGSTGDHLPRTLRPTRDGAPRWAVILTRDKGPNSLNFDAAHREVVAGVATILMAVSLLKQDKFTEILMQAAERGLLNHVAPHIRYDRAYSVVTRAVFDAPTRQLMRPHGQGQAGAPLQHPSLAARTDPGPGFTDEKARQLAANRYAAFTSMLRFTLPRLRNGPAFLEIVNELRTDGWQDWHILQAILNLLVNYRNALNPVGSEELIRQLQAQTPEEADAPPLPAELVTREKLEKALQFSYAATAKLWDLEVRSGSWQPDPVASVLASRYGYWTSDSPHDDPFQP